MVKFYIRAFLGYGIGQIAVAVLVLEVLLSGDFTVELLSFGNEWRVLPKPYKDKSGNLRNNEKEDYKLNGSGPPTSYLIIKSVQDEEIRLIWVLLVYAVFV